MVKKQILKLFRGILKKLIPAVTDFANKMQQTCRYSLPKEIRTRRLGTAHSTKALFLQISNLDRSVSSSIQKKIGENSQFWTHPISNHART